MNLNFHFPEHNTTNIKEYAQHRAPSLPDFHLWLVVPFHNLGGEILQAESSLQGGPYGAQVGAQSGSLWRKPLEHESGSPILLPFTPRSCESGSYEAACDWRQGEQT